MVRVIVRAFEGQNMPVVMDRLFATRKEAILALPKQGRIERDGNVYRCLVNK